MIQTTLRATGGSVTTTVPSEVAQRMGVGPGQAINWIDEGNGMFRITPADATQQPILDAAQRVIEKYRPVFAKLGREEG
jgi:hypothetical protein